MNIEINQNIKETIIIPVFQENEKINFFNNKLNKTLKKSILEKIKIFKFTGENEQTLFTNIESQKIQLIGIDKNYSLETLRRAYSISLNILKKEKEFNFSVEIPRENKDEIISIIESVELTNYSFNKYLKKEESQDININIFIDSRYQKTIEQAQIISKHVKFVRNIINENADIMTPIQMEKLAKEFAKKNKIKIKVLDEKKILSENLNLLYSVGKGAANPPRLIILEYKGNIKSQEKIALVGKGITFDTGGINLKPTGHIEDMKTDMGGAATVFGIFKAAVELKLQKNLICILACAENSISSKAYKPGDIITSLNGLSIQIGNTDAEGRLVLADALAYLQNNYTPTKIIDMATLTGACLIALGPKLIAMLGNNSEIKSQIFEAGEKTYERVWELPIYEEHEKAIKGKFSDLINISSGISKGKGGTITAAAFLQNFIKENTPWIHLDIAGAARSHSQEYYIPEMATGRGVRLILEYLMKN